MKLKRKTEIVKKNVGAIQIKAKLSLIERKISNALLFNAYEELLTSRRHKIDIKTMSSIIGFDSKNTNSLKDALRKLNSTLIEWNYLDEKNKEVWAVSSLLAYGEIKDGICTYEYSSALAEKFYNPEIYARINLAVQRNISSSYALVLYEICVRYLNVGTTGWISLIDFKALIGVDDVETYRDFKYLNNQLIKPIVKEINSATNIFIETEFKRENRTVVAIKFLIKENPQLNLLDFEQEDEISKSLAYKTLIEKGISKIMARQWIIEHGEAYILEKLEVTQHAKARGGLKSESGFLIKAVSENYTDTTIIEKKAIAAAQEKKTQKQRKEQTAQKIQKDILAIEKAHREACNRLIGEKLGELSSEDEKLLFSDVKAKIQSGIDLKDFTQRRWKSILNAKLIRETFSARFSLRFPTQNETAMALDLPSLEKLRAMKNKYIEENE